MTQTLQETVVLRDVIAAVRPDLYSRAGLEAWLTQRGVPGRYAENFLRLFTTNPQHVLDSVLSGEDLLRVRDLLRLQCDFEDERDPS